jgi:hypothetical protein
LGAFNGNSNKRNFARQMLNYTDEHPEEQIDFRNIDPPVPSQVAAVFPGPLVLVSSFSLYSQARFVPNAKRTINKFKRMTTAANTKSITSKPAQRTNIQFISGRAYISKLGLECGSDDKVGVGTCNEPGQQQAGRNPADMHRCPRRSRGL